MPRVIILAGFETYTNLCKEKYNPLLSGIVSCSILDSASVCFKKNEKPTFIIASTEEVPGTYMDRFQAIHDLYFPNVIEQGDTTMVLDQIINYYNTK